MCAPKKQRNRSSYQYFPCKMGGYSFRILYREEVDRRGFSGSKIHDLITFVSITYYWWITKHATNFDQKADSCQHDILPCNDWEPNRYVNKTYSKKLPLANEASCVHYQTLPLRVGCKWRRWRRNYLKRLRFED